MERGDGGKEGKEGRGRPVMEWEWKGGVYSGQPTSLCSPDAGRRVGPKACHIRDCTAALPVPEEYAMRTHPLLSRAVSQPIFETRPQRGRTVLIIVFSSRIVYATFLYSKQNQSAIRFQEFVASSFGCPSSSAHLPAM